jgi:hypothetical protein
MTSKGRRLLLRCDITEDPAGAPAGVCYDAELSLNVRTDSGDPVHAGTDVLRYGTKRTLVHRETTDEE